MVRNLSTKEIYNSIVNEFLGAWNSIASNPNSIGRGNFMFASQAMHLLEFAARLYGSDTSAHQSLSEDLNDIEPKYFTPLPGPCAATKSRYYSPFLDNYFISYCSIIYRMFRIHDDSSSIIIHEHDFVSIRTKEEDKEQKSIICLTCGSLYCESCGKLLLTVHGKNYMQHNLYN